MRKAITLLLALVMTASLTYADFHPAPNVPNLITYQGKLLTAAGLPMNNEHNIVFRIMDAASGGTQIWSETQTVNVVNGLYTVVLGSVTPLPTTLTAHTSLYLEVVVDEVTLSPRTRLLSVPYAMMSQTIDRKGATAGQYLQWHDSIAEPATPAGWFPSSIVNTLQGAYNGGDSIVLHYGETGYTLPVTIGYEVVPAIDTPTVLRIAGNVACVGNINATNLLGNGTGVTHIDPYHLDQRGAVLGQVLAWDTTDARWEPSSIVASLQGAYQNNHNESGNTLTTAAEYDTLKIAGTTGLQILSPFYVNNAKGMGITNNSYDTAAISVTNKVNGPVARFSGTSSSTPMMELFSNGEGTTLSVQQNNPTGLALDVNGIVSLTGMTSLQNLDDNIPTMTVNAENAQAATLTNNSFLYPTISLTNIAAGQVVNVTGTSETAPMVELVNDGAAPVLSISQSNTSANALEVSGKTAFGSEVQLLVSGDNALTARSDKYALSMQTGNLKLSSLAITVTGNVVLSAANDDDYYSSVILGGTPGSNVGVALPSVTADDAGRIIVLVNNTDFAQAINNATGALQLTLGVKATVTLMCIGANTWASVGAVGTVLP